MFITKSYSIVVSLHELVIIPKKDLILSKKFLLFDYCQITKKLIIRKNIRVLDCIYDSDLILFHCNIYEQLYVSKLDDLCLIKKTIYFSNCGNDFYHKMKLLGDNKINNPKRDYANVKFFRNEIIYNDFEMNLYRFDINKHTEQKIGEQGDSFIICTNYLFICDSNKKTLKKYDLENNNSFIIYTFIDNVNILSFGKSGNYIICKYKNSKNVFLYSISQNTVFPTTYPKLLFRENACFGNIDNWFNIDDDKSIIHINWQKYTSPNFLNIKISVGCCDDDILALYDEKNIKIFKFY